MSETLWDQPLSAFRDAIASTEPTPGGGSVAMVSATFGLGLVVMALEITAKKPEPGSEAQLAELLAEARSLLAVLSAHADEDVAVFQTFMATLKLPKGTEKEKTARKQAMQAALLEATEEPLAAADSCVAALALAEKAAALSSVRVVSDVGAGAALIGGAASAVLLNVDINLPSIADSALKMEFSQSRLNSQAEASRMAESILKVIASRLTSDK